MSPSGPLLLAVDTAGPDAGVVLAGPGMLQARLLPVGERGQARTEDLALLAAELLGECGLQVSALTLVGAVTGPGSYTGLRAGLAFLRGLALPAALPAVAVDALELLAWRAAAPGETVHVALPLAPDRLMAATCRREAAAVVPVLPPSFHEDALMPPLPAVGATAVVVPASLHDRMAEVAGRSGLPLRVPEGEGTAGLLALAGLILARAEAGEALGVDDLLPLYAGPTLARPNRERVALGNPQE